MASFWTLVLVEFPKLVRRPMTWILALIYAAFVGLIYLAYIFLLVGNSAEGVNKQDIKDLLYLPDGLSFGMGIVVSIATISFIILAAGSFGSEFNWATVRTLLLMRAGRVRLFFAKLLVVELLGVLAVVAGTLAVICGSTIAGALGEGGPAVSDWLTSAFLADVVLFAFRVWICVAFWTLIAAEISIVTHSLGIGIGATLATYFVGSITSSLLKQAGQVGEYVSRILPNAGIDALLRLNNTDPPHFVTTDYVWIILNIATYTAVATAVGLVRFRSMNILSASAA